MRKRTVNTYPALPQQAHPQVPKPATRHSPPRLVFTHPLAVISPYWLAERPMRRPIAFRPTCSLVFSVLVCSNVCTPLPPGYAWLLRPCPLVCHAILKGDRALPSGVGPADRGALGGHWGGGGDLRSGAGRVTFRLVVVPLRGPGQSPVLPFACCVGSLRSVGRCGRCSCWCRFRVRGAQRLVCWGCAECGGMCRLRVSGAQ